MRQKAYYTVEETFYNLYTTGQEWMTEDLVEYKGAYHSYTTGETFTESTWRPDKSVKLIKFERPSKVVTEYKKLKSVTTKYKPIQSFYPSVTEKDKAAKFITRYFIKKINESAITEIDETQFKDWTNKKIDPNLYTAVSIQWQIAGQLSMQITNGITIPSVATINAQRVSVLEKTMPGISKKLNNYIELYSDTDYIVPNDINQ